MGLSCTLGQNGTIRGVVYHLEETSYLDGAAIYLEGQAKGTFSDGKGAFEISEVQPGHIVLYVSSIGYETQEIGIDLDSNEVIEVKVNLVETIANLKEVTVISGGVSGMRNIPGAVHYLSPKIIEAHSYVDPNRLLKLLPGVNIQEEDGFGLRPNIGLRGTGVERSSKITVMEDGILMAPAPYAAPAAYYFPTIGRMNGVEVVTGSSQIKYGPYTTGGAINLISTPIPKDFSGKLAIWGGNFGTANLHAHIGDSQEQVSYLLEHFSSHSNGFKYLSVPRETGYRKADYLAKVKYNSKPSALRQQSILFKIGHSEEQSNETYLGLSQDAFQKEPFRRYAASQMDQIQTDQVQMSATHFLQWNRRLQFKSMAYRTTFNRNWYKLDKVISENGDRQSLNALLEDPYGENWLEGNIQTNQAPYIVKANNRSYYSQGLQTQVFLDLSNNQLEHHLEIGLRWHKDGVDRFQWEDRYDMDQGIMTLQVKGEPGTESNRILSANAFAGHVQYTFKRGPWVIIPGFRWEQIEWRQIDYGKEDPGRTGLLTRESHNSNKIGLPGIGIQYEWNSFSKTFLGIHKGFSPSGIAAETNPEVSVNYELGWRYNKGAYSWQVVGFYNDYRNLLGSDLAAVGGLGSGQLYNAGAVKTQGLELVFQYSGWTIGDGKINLPLGLNYTFTDARFKNSFESDFEEWGWVEAGDEYPYLAKSQLGLVAEVIWGPFSLLNNIRYQSPMRLEPGKGNGFNGESIEDYWMVDLTTSWQLRKEVKVFGQVTNIFNQVVGVARRPAGWRPAMPRAFNLGIRAAF